MDDFNDAPSGAIAFGFEDFELRDADANKRKFCRHEKAVTKQEE